MTARQRITGTVVEVLPLGRYRIEDDLGRTYQAEANGQYKPGDRVQVLDGLIVGTAGIQPVVKTYQV